MASYEYTAMGEAGRITRCDYCGDVIRSPLEGVRNAGVDICLIKCWPLTQEGKKSPLPANDTGFVKHDAGKPMMSILPWDALEAVARVMTQPVVSGKYSADNWRKCTDPERYESAALRHYAAMKRGEMTDPDSGEPHAAHYATNALFALAIRLSTK